MKAFALRNCATDRGNFFAHLAQTLIRGIVGGRLPGVELIVLAILGEGNIGHNNISPGLQSFCLPVGRKRFHGGCGRDVDVGQ